MVQDLELDLDPLGEVEREPGDGRLRGNKVLCPMHGGSFDARDGSALSKPAREPLDTWQVRVEDYDILLGPMN